MLRDTIIRRSTIYHSNNGIAYTLDPSRSDLPVSINRQDIYFNNDHKNISTTRWLNVIGGIPSNQNGYLIKRNSLITAISINAKNTVSDASFFIYDLNTMTLIHTENISGTSTKIVDNLNYQLNTGDRLSVQLQVNSNTVDYPEFNIEYAYRFN